MIFKLSTANQDYWGIESVNSTTEGFGLNFWNNKDIGSNDWYSKYSILFLDGGRQGNVGVGTTSPTAKLDVEGSFKAIDLGDMQSKLLQKVEELTLYIIELQKQMDELKQTKGEKP